MATSTKPEETPKDNPKEKIKVTLKQSKDDLLVEQTKIKNVYHKKVQSESLQKSQALVQQYKSDLETTQATIRQLQSQKRSFVGSRYRTRTESEKQRIEELTKSKEELEALAKAKALARAQAKAEAEAQAQVDAKAVASLQEKMKTQQEVYEKAKKELEVEMSSLGLNEEKKQLDDIDAKINAIDQELQKIDDEITAEWRKTEEAKRAAEDRSLDNLYGDIKKHSWMLNPSKGLSSTQILQQLETRQRQIENGQLPTTDDYAETNAYFLYSETRECCIMLKKESAKPAKWRIEHYYKPSPLDDVTKIFNSCKGKSVGGLGNTPVDPNRFANVTL
jgi:membrane protein involved in colicin uptake